VEFRFAVPLFSTYRGGVAACGPGADGIAAIDEALGISERHEERWCVAELLPIKGELLLLHGAPTTSPGVEDYFHLALDWARFTCARRMLG
jgi:hypothetical protein